MGCCHSTPSDDNNSPYSPTAAAHHHADSSQHPITSAAQPTAHHQPRFHPPATPSTASSPTHPPSSGHRHHLPLHEHFNRPLRPHVWRSNSRAWTSSQLQRERTDFFDTRVTGRPEVWSALAAATEMLRLGDVATAQGIVDAAGITVPSGDLADGCYDEGGAFYRLQPFVVADPANLVTDEASRTRDGAGIGEGVREGKAGVEDDSGSGTEDEDEETIKERREEKGKGSERDAIKVKARLSDRGGPDVVILIGKTQTVGVLARRVQSEAGIKGKKSRIRIAYLGKMLKENQSLLDQGWKEGHVVNALVATPPSPR